MFEDLADQWQNIWVNELVSLERRSGVPVDDWTVGGRKSREKPEGENAAWWQAEGLRQAEAYIEWLANTGWSIATLPDGRPGIEWDAVVDFGGRPVKAIIDAVFTNGEDLIVVDYKTGRKRQQPPQLGLYASIIERTQGVRPKWGGYYMSRDAKVDDLFDLSTWSMDFYDYSFGVMNIAVNTGMFVPNVSDHCSWCGVRDYCVAQGGSKSSSFPLHTKGI
jgi:hypothetical protein